MVVTLQRLMPVTVLLTSCAFSVTRGSVLATRHCTGAPIRAAHKFGDIASRSRSPLAVSAMAKPIIIAPRAEHTGTVIMLHGLGDTGAGWAGIAPQFAEELPNVKFIFPTAAERRITVNMGMRMTGWFDIVSLDDIHQKEDEQGLRDSVQQIEELVRDEQANGVSKVVVAGFSQGGAVALLTLRSELNLAGVAGLSTWLTLSAEPLVSEANKATPVWMAHGSADQVVKYEYGERSFEALKAAGVNAEFMRIPGMGHSADAGELNCFQSWLGKVLA